MNTPICRKNAVRIAVAAALLLPTVTFADDADANARLQQLEKMMQQMQQQRAEQDQQLQALNKELIAVQEQLALAKEGKLEEKGKAKGNPVYATFSDGVRFEDGSGNWNLQFNGRVQADFRSFDPDEDMPDTWSIRRARFNMQLGFFKDYLMRMEIDHSASSTRLVNAYVEANWWPQFRLRAGQFKVLKGLENSTTDSYSDFIERSLAYNTFADDIYERGIMAFGVPAKGTYYAMAVTNGTGQGNDEVVGTTRAQMKHDQKDVTFRATINPAQWAEWNKAVTHLGGWYSHGIQATNTAGPSQTEARGVTFFSPSAFTGNDVERTRWGWETALAYGPVKFQGEYDVSNYQGTTSSTTAAFNNKAYDKDVKAWYAEMMWLVSGENYADSYKDGQFGRILPKQAFTTGKAGWGALELGLRYSKFDGNDFDILTSATCSGSTIKNPGNGVLLPGGSCSSAGVFTKSGVQLQANKADAWTVGAKWLLNPYARLMFNYIHTKFDTDLNINGTLQDKEDAITMRAQFDF